MGARPETPRLLSKRGIGILLVVTKVIRNRDGLFLKHDGKWTADFEQARKFYDLLPLLKAKEQFQIRDNDAVVVALVNSRPSKYDVVLSFQSKKENPQKQHPRRKTP